MMNTAYGLVGYGYYKCPNGSTYWTGVYGNKR